MGWSTRMATGMVAVALTAPAGAAQESTFEWRDVMRPGEELRVQGIVGEIRAEYTSGDRAEVVARKAGRSSDFDQVDIRMERRGDEVVVCAVYRPRRAEGCSNVHDDDGDRRDRRSIDVEVDFVVRVPAGVDFSGGLVSGDVVAENLRSDVEVATVDGDIRVSTSGIARARTVSGSIEVAMGSAEWTELDFATVSGDVTLWLPDGVDTDVDFQSLSGDLRSDFDVTRTGGRSERWIGESLEGHIGARGRRSLSFNTVSGDVRLRRTRS